MAVGLVAIVVRLLLAWTGARRQPDRLAEEGDARTEAVGSPKKDARALVDWLWAWLRRHIFGGPVAAGPQGGAVLDVSHSNAREAYRQLLAWARARGITRRESETTHQFLVRLDQHAPDAAPAFELITDVYEWDRYGHKPSPRERLTAVRRHLEQLLSRPSA
jgi:hypothetical protein